MTLTDACVAFTGPQEGIILWPYVDSVGKVTVGCGHMLPDVESACAVLGLDPADVQPHWNTLLASAPGHLASYYADVTDLRLSADAADSLFREDLTHHIEQCQRRVPDFDALPQPVQVACVDINFNVGDVRKFPRMLAAVAAGDWEQAAVESNRPQLPARSKATAALIRTAV